MDPVCMAAWSTTVYMPVVPGSACIQPCTHTRVMDMQAFCDLALESIREYRPEIERLDVKSDKLREDLAKVDQDVVRIEVSGVAVRLDGWRRWR